MGSAKAVLMREADCDTGVENDTAVSSDVSEVSRSASHEEELAVKRTLLKKQRTSPYILINRNGSRFIMPIDIVRSKLGREEILKQTSQNERPRPSASKKRGGESKV